MTNMAEGKKIGEIIHYFGEIEVAIIKLSDSLKIGEKIRIAGGEDTDFTQEVSSMEIDYEEVESAKKGMEVGVKVKEKVREGYQVFKV